MRTLWKGEREGEKKGERKKRGEKGKKQAIKKNGKRLISVHSLSF